jgi:L-lactate dehydrogenase
MLGHGRVLSTGTYLDSLRFRFHLARRLGVSPACVDAQIVGEHGTTEVFLWSSARIAGKPVLELLERTAGQNREELRQQIERQVRYANIAIIEGIGASQHGIGMACARIAEILLRNEPAVIPISSYNLECGSRCLCRAFSDAAVWFGPSSHPCPTRSVRRYDAALIH